MGKLSAGPIPLYHQLEQDFSARIAAREFRPGDALPTEQQIGQTYGVSRITVRKALDALDRAGLIVRRRGIGSFVSEPNTGVHAIRLNGSLDDFLQTANRLSPHVIALGTVPAPDHVAAVFNIAPGDDVARLELVSSTEDGPLAHSEFHFPQWIAKFLRRDDIRTTEPIVRMIERVASVRVARAEQIIEPTAASADTARLLDVALGTPLLHSQRTYFTTDGVPIEIASLCYHPERYSYRVELRARPYSV